MADKKIVEAVKSAIEAGKKRQRKFDESVDLAINIKEVDLTIPKNRIQEEIPLPNGRDKNVKIAVFASGELALKVKDVADRVITPEEIGELAEDKRAARKVANEYEFFLADVGLMATIGKSLGVALGPRGKMPKPLPPNADPTNLIAGLKRTIRVRSKDKPTFHCTVGSVKMDPEKIAENIEAVLKRIEAKLANGRMNIRSIYVKTTMGPSVKIDLG